MQAKKEDKFKEILLTGSKKMGVYLNDNQLLIFLKYLQELKKYRELINISGIVNEEDILIKHFLDSLACLVSKKIKPEDLVVDIGSGAGFPGIPLKIVMDNIDLTLVESVEKRAKILSFITEELDLKKVKIVNKRMENFIREGEREKYDIATARAISSLPVILEYALPAIKVDGYFLALKGPKAKEEIKFSKRALEELKGKVETLLKVEIPYLNAERFIVIVRKIAETPQKYPRRTGIPQKRPL